MRWKTEEHLLASRKMPGRKRKGERTEIARFYWCAKEHYGRDWTLYAHWMQKVLTRAEARRKLSQIAYEEEPSSGKEWIPTSH
ncbi:MAG: hypothetical protein ACXQTR_01025 [Candidatus Methanospirareceae archaeon]